MAKKKVFSTLEDVPDRTRLFIDATIFIYHFTGVSPQCRRVLERCEAGRLKAATSVITVAELAHRLMMIEAVQRRLVSEGNVVRKLRERPSVVQKLHSYAEQVGRVPLMGIEVIPVDLKTLFGSRELRDRYGLMVNDSFIARSAIDAGYPAVASADPDFARVDALQLYVPTDLAS